MERIMSLGYNCLSAQILKSFGIREPGPVDWTLQLTSESLYQVLSGALFNNIINKQFSVSYNVADKGYVTEVPGGFRLSHEYLNDPTEYCKFIIRCVHLIDHIKNNGRFMLCMSPNYTQNDIITIRECLEAAHISDDKLFVIGDTKLVESFTYHYGFTNTNHLTYDIWKDIKLYNAFMKSIKCKLESWYGEKLKYIEPTQLATITTVPKFDGSFNTTLNKITY